MLFRSTPAPRTKPENTLLNLTCNLVVPTIVLMKFSTDAWLGPLWGLLVALVFPIGYGIYDLITRRKTNYLSILGLVSVLLSGAGGAPARAELPAPEAPGAADPLAEAGILVDAHGMRFADETLLIQQHQQSFGPVLGAVTFGPAKRADGNPGLFHYGIHSVELLLQLLGPGCESVRTTYSDGAEVVTAQWTDGRIGTVRGNRHGSTAYGYVAFCERGVIPQLVSTRNSYRNLLRAFVQSLDSRTPAVPPSSSLEVVRFILASLRSEQTAGDRKSTRLNSSHIPLSRMPSSA